MSFFLAVAGEPKGMSAVTLTVAFFFSRSFALPDFSA